MKNLLFLSVLMLSVSSVSAENLFQNSNPFPQTSPQTMNNIYESEPSIMQNEVKQAKKSWFRKGKNLQKSDESINHVIPESKIINEGAKENGFYVFK